MHGMMERLSTSWEYFVGSGTTKDMIEQAEEELQILEAQHPNRFNYLKLELKSFISHLESQNLLLPKASNNTISSSVTTQESSVGKKRKKSAQNGQTMEGKNVAVPKGKLQRTCISSSDSSCSMRRDRVDVVVERARACLHKIQQLKTSFS